MRSAVPSQPPAKPSPPASRRERRELARASTPRVRARSAVPKPPAWRSPLALVSGAAVVVVVAVILLVQKPAPSSNDGELVAPPANAAVAAGLADGETLGQASAPLTVEIWSDFQCPICGSLVRDYMPRLLTDFVIPGLVKLVPHDIDVVGATAQSESLAAAVGARCAGAQEKYWPYHDWLFYNQNGENKGAFSADRLALIADKVGLDRTAWNACIADPAQSAAIRTTTAQSASQGVSATPSFRFGGQVQVGLPRAYADLASSIRKSLPSAAPTGTRTAAPSASADATPPTSPAASQ
jgi:protein-disulfide isomerase